MTVTKTNVETISAYFENLVDPRRERGRKHLLVDVIVIAMCGILCGCDGPTGIHRWAAERADWLGGFLRLPHGIPSKDCIRRLLIAVRPDAFQECFQEWLGSLADTEATTGDRTIAIDGKTCRGSHDQSKNLGALHIVSAWATSEGIALGQVATSEKSNEITAIPELLDRIDVKDAVVTIDAMGCQKEIADKIVEGGGNYVLMVKDNHPTLRNAIQEYFEEGLDRDPKELGHRHHEQTDKGHGRIEDRVYVVSKLPESFPETLRKEWPSIKAIGYAFRITKQADGTETDEVRYYILSRFMAGEKFANASRKHWSIEAMHWVLDVNFRDDHSRTRERTLANNLSWLRRFAIGLLKRHPSKDSIRGKMIRCMINQDFLTEVLMN